MRRGSGCRRAGVQYAESQGAASIAHLRAKSAEVLLESRGLLRSHCRRFLPSGRPIHGLFPRTAKRSSGPLGSTADEPAGQLELLKPEAFIADAAKRYGALAGAYLKLYPAGSDEETRRRKEPPVATCWRPRCVAGHGCIRPQESPKRTCTILIAPPREGTAHGTGRLLPENWWPTLTT